MPVATHQSEAPTAIRIDLGAIFVSLELSRQKWLITSLSPAGGEKMSKHAVAAGDIAGLLARFAELKKKAEARTGQCFPIIVIQEAGLDGFWIHRVLEAEGIESHVVDCDFAPAPPRKDRQDRRRGAGPGFAGLQARRATGVCDAPGAGARGGGPSPHHA